MGSFESLMKRTDFSEKCINMHKIERVRFIEVNKYFGALETIEYFVAYIRYRIKSKISVRSYMTMKF